MVWFYCDGCCDTIKKPKLLNHFRQCGGHTFTCVDCSRTFDRQSAQGHSTCVSEHEKYALGVTKPGGYAAQGFYKEGQQQPAAVDKGQQEIIGMEFLSERPPWKCSCCSVDCTSRDTLLGHATGVKHKRRARAALGLTGQQQQQQQNGRAAAPADQQQPAQPASDVTQQNSEKELQLPPEQKSGKGQEEEQPDSKQQKKEKKDKVGKSEKKKRKQEPEQQEQQPADESPAAAQQDKPKSKKQKKEKEAKQPEQQQDTEGLEPLLKVAKKKLKTKGKLGLKKLEALLKQHATGTFSAHTLEAVKQQLLAYAQVKLTDSKLLWDAGN